MLLKQKKQIEMLRLDGIADFGNFLSMAALNSPVFFLYLRRRTYGRFCIKKDHIIKKYFSRIRLSYLTTENLSTFTESILQNLEETS